MSHNIEEGSDLDTFVTTIVGNRPQAFDLDGETFSWWATAERPYLVTVTSDTLGHKVRLTDSNAEQIALTLARELLHEHSARIVADGKWRRA